MRADKDNSSASGLILMHKMPGITSFDSLRNIKHFLGTGKVGHTGTLDKFAEGLLLVLTGRALKLSQIFTHSDKQYEAQICFGSETDTLDPEGCIVSRAPLPSLEALEQAIPQFIGEIEQIPPAYSAIYMGGKRAADLVRRGEAVEMKKRPVSIYQLELLSWEPPFARIFVHCSCGTYIRSLARDIATTAGSRAHLSALLRTKIADFKLEEVVSPLTIFPIDKTVFDRLEIPCIEVNPENAANLINGKPLTNILKSVSDEIAAVEKKSIAIFSNNKFIAMIENKNNNWVYGFVYEGN